MDNNEVCEILLNWNLQNIKIEKIYNTAWQAGDSYILKEYHDLQMLERNLKILDILDKMHIPVGRIVPVVNNNGLYVKNGDLFYFLSEKLPGGNLKNITDIKGMALKIGGIIACLHKAFKECENDINGLWNNSLLDEMNNWVRKNFEDNNWKYISKEEYGQAVLNLSELYNGLPVQLIHRDVHFGNFLFKDGQFSGYIDFDLSQRNIRVFDICYFVLGLLAEEEELKLTQEQWFVFLKHTFTGYNNTLSLQEAEKKAVPYVMECIELLFASYFESINNMPCADGAINIYKFIKKNEDKITGIINYI